MSLPPSFSGTPDEEQSHYYRNVCLEFEKVIKSDASLDRLHQEMERFLNASKEVHWPHHTDDKYHKDVVEKAVSKVVAEFRRYVKMKESEPEKAQNEDLLRALKLVQAQVDMLRVR